jgi:hypothetical protein
MLIFVVTLRSLGRLLSSSGGIQQAISDNTEGGANMDINEIHEVETVEVASDLVMASFTSYNC